MENNKLTKQDGSLTTLTFDELLSVTGGHTPILIIGDGCGETEENNEPGTGDRDIG